MPWEENAFSCMKRNVQPDSVNKKIMIISLGDYSGPTPKSHWNTSLPGAGSAIKLWKFAVNKIQNK